MVFLLAAATLVVIVLACSTVLATCAAYTFNNYIEAQRELEHKQQFEQTLAVANHIAEKIPEFRLLSRRHDHGKTPGTIGGRRGLFGR